MKFQVNSQFQTNNFSKFQSIFKVSNQFSTFHSIFNSKQEKPFSYGQNKKRRILEMNPHKGFVFHMTDKFLYVSNSYTVYKLHLMSKICYRENSYKVLTILRKKHLTLKTVIMRPRRYAKSPMNYISALLFFVTHSAYHCKYSYYN